MVAKDVKLKDIACALTECSLKPTTFPPGAALWYELGGEEARVEWGLTPWHHSTTLAITPPPLKKVKLLPPPINPQLVAVPEFTAASVTANSEFKVFYCFSILDIFLNVF